MHRTLALLPLAVVVALPGLVVVPVPAHGQAAAALPDAPPAPEAGVATFRERFRPQFHFTPERNWMNDPNGMVFFDGEYHLFHQFNPFGDRWGHMSWGHAVSRDLVRWEHRPVALPEADGVMIFSGSAVVDWGNTSGFGTGETPPLVAIYTGHHTEKPLQDQRLAFSNDRGRTWTKFAGNPVLDIGNRDFRDPKVVWHAPTGRWIMAVALAVERKISFYGSPDLKDWTHLSDFGGAGSRAGIWECPDLFPLPVEGDADADRWVLVVNVGSGAPAGGSGCQYFVGDFDGTRFALDPDSTPRPEPEVVPAGTVLADFEGGTYGTWTATGEAFGDAPAPGALDGQMAVGGFRGAGLVNSFRGGDASVGRLRSPAFVVTRRHLNFLVGGGAHAGETCVNLLVDGEIARTATGRESEILEWTTWNLSDLQGREAVIEIVDTHTGGWGHINADEFMLADEPARAAREPALWADRGPDFYAAVSWSDVPPEDGRRIWIGWMSNWQYAQDVPTSPWRSAMTVPRTLTLRPSGGGLRLAQRPVRELDSLRIPGAAATFAGGSFAEADRWLRGLGPLPRLLDIEIAFAAEAGSSNGEAPPEFGLRVGTGEAADEATTIGIDSVAGHWFVDRTRSGDTGFHAAFPRRHVAPGAEDPESHGGGHVFRILVDTSSIEVFAGRGASVITSLVFPEDGPARLALFPGPDARDAGQAAPLPAVRSIAIHPMKSIWPAPPR